MLSFALSSSTTPGSISLGSGQQRAPAAGLFPGAGFWQCTGLQYFSVLLLQEALCHVPKGWPI